MSHLTGKNSGLTHDLEIRLLGPDDLDGAQALSTAIGWNQRLEDWQMLTSLAPAGSFCATDHGRIVATAIGIDYTAFGWVAMMLVDPAYRGHGLGARLLEAALGALPASRPVRLDATPLGRPLYERYGFTLETTLTRYLRAATGVGGAAWRQAAASPSRWVRPVLTPEDHLPAGRRQHLLGWMQANAPEYAFAVDDMSAEYCLGRHGRLYDQIGPVVAASAERAIPLAGGALANAPGPVIVDAYDAHEPFTSWLRTAGFEPQRPLYRMCRGGPVSPAGEGGVTEFAILGPEFG